MQASGAGSNSREEIEAEAARLLARLNSNPTPQDEAEICAWIEADPSHAIAYARAEAAWEAAERLKSAAAEVNLPPIVEVVTEEQQRRLSRNIMIVAGVAVILFILAAIVTIRTFTDVDHHETRVGQIRTISLRDGSRLHLNSDSAVDVRFTSNGRKVRLLKGEAAIEVAADSQRDFDVEARSAIIRARDAVLNLRLRPSLMELMVTKGTAIVSCGNRPPRQVAAGNGAVLQPRSFALTRLDPSVIRQRTAWRRQLVQLQGETIEQAAGEFNRYREAPILIGDARVSALRVGGEFHIGDSGKFLSLLQARLPIRAVSGDD
ncbi:MAG TPA: FecR domain-containing protein [Sphingobium sp.]|nr:FecR domain-containing protein [Sphingobium sp.]